MKNVISLFFLATMTLLSHELLAQQYCRYCGAQLAMGVYGDVGCLNCNPPSGYPAWQNTGYQLDGFSGSGLVMGFTLLSSGGDLNSMPTPFMLNDYRSTQEHRLNKQRSGNDKQSAKTCSDRRAALAGSTGDDGCSKWGCSHRDAVPWSESSADEASSEQQSLSMFLGSFSPVVTVADESNHFFQQAMMIYDREPETVRKRLSTHQGSLTESVKFHELLRIIRYSSWSYESEQASILIYFPESNELLMLLKWENYAGNQSTTVSFHNSGGVAQYTMNISAVSFLGLLNSTGLKFQLYKLNG